MAEPVLHRGAHRDELDAAGVGAGGEEVRGLEQQRAAAIELARGAQRRGERDADVDRRS